MRCFVAAWPDDGTRERLARLQASLAAAAPGARPMQPRNFHLTLAFIGNLDDAAAHALALPIDALGEAVPSCTWSMETLDWFRRPRVAWIGGDASAALADVTARARALLDALGIAYDRKPFVPHVTLFRDVRSFAVPTLPQRLPQPLPWITARVALYASARDRDGPLYREVEARCRSR